MRLNIYNMNVRVFLRALQNLGWKEVTPNKRLGEREFTKDRFHLFLRKRKLGHYCVIHKNRFMHGHHVKPVTKGDELRLILREITGEYRRIVSR